MIFSHTKNLFKLSVISFLTLLVISCKSKEKPQENLEVISKPNVLLLVVDDQGYGDIAALGNKVIKTPNIDNLHKISTRFTQFHVSPTCSPSRAAIMTGHHSNRTGVWSTVNGRSLILERETTIAQVFKDNGYSTAIFGKWHLGDNYPFRPQDKGFDEVFIHGGGGIEQTMDHWDNNYYDDVYIHNGEPEKVEGFCTDVWFENTIKYIENTQKQNKPFFCYLPTNAAHTPYFVDDKYSDPYRDNKDVPSPEFYGLLANVDENIGKLVDYLKSSNLMDDTIIVFTTDNGTSAGAKIPKTDDRLDGFVTKGYNAGMRGIKASMYEGGHRVPLFIHWKNGGIKAGNDINELTAHFDILPTLIDLCKLNTSPELKFDGKSLVPLMNGNKEEFEERIIITNSQRIEVPEPWRRTALMHKNWRLVNGNELYDLNTDPEQRNNIADQYPEKIEAYKKAYDEWWNDLEPGYSDIPRIYVGHKSENPTKLFCHDWHTEKAASPWHQRHIRTGYVDNGYWTLKVASAGTYNLKLRRWPEEIALPLNGKAPVRPAKPGTSVKETKKSKSLTIEKAKISIQGVEQTKEVDPSAEFVEFTVDLKEGDTELTTWFTLDSGKELGAYYVSFEKI